MCINDNIQKDDLKNPQESMESKSIEMFDKTVEAVFDESMKKNVMSIKLLLKCFHSIVYDQFCEDFSNPLLKSLLDHKEHQIFHKYRIKAVYVNKNSINTIINFCLKQMPLILNDVFSEKSKKYSSLKIQMKIYLLDQFVMLNCLNNSSESLISIVSSINTVNRLLNRYPKILHSYIKLFVKMLEYHDEDVRISCFDLLRKWSNTKKADSIYQQIDKIYLSSNGFSKYHDAYSSLWLFMKVSICELLSVTPQNAYLIFFKRCKQMIFDLQNAIVTNDKKSSAKIYSWQFVHSIELITFAICNEANPNSLLSSNLVHPTTQIMLATLNSSNSPKFIPFKLHIIKCLTKLVTETNVYIPLTLHYMNILERKEFLVVGSNVISANTKEPVLGRMIKVSKDQALLNHYKASVFNTVIEHFLQFLIAFSNNIAFPDLIFLPTKWLKKILKDTKVKRQSMMIKTIIQKMEENARKISDIRFTMGEGSSLFTPIKLDENVNKTANVGFNLKLPMDQNSIANYLVYLKENNFNESIQKPVLDSKSPVNNPTFKKGNQKIKQKNTLKRATTNLKGIKSLKSKNEHLSDEVVDLNLSD